MIGKHFLCKDPGCKICAERMADKIIKEESAKFYPGRGEMTEKEKAVIRDAGKKIYDYKTVDDLRIEEAKEYTKEDMIRAFVWSARFALEQVWAVVNPMRNWGGVDQEVVEKLARHYLKEDKLGREGK